MKRLFSMMIAFVMLAACAFAELPRPDDTGIDMVIGEHMGEYYAEVQLFYESGNGMELTGVTRNVYVPQDGNLVEAALTELFAVGHSVHGPKTSADLPPAHTNASAGSSMPNSSRYSLHADSRKRSSPLWEATYIMHLAQSCPQKHTILPFINAPP